MLSSARDAYVERLDSADLAPQQKAMLLRVAGLKDTDSLKKEAEIEFTEQDGLLSVQNAKRMLRWLAEAVGRGLELSGGNETPKDVSAILDLLLLHMGELYIETSLDALVLSRSYVWLFLTIIGRTTTLQLKKTQKSNQIFLTSRTFIQLSPSCT